MNKLDEICDKKRAHVVAQKAEISLDELKEKVVDAQPVRGFIGALMKAQGPALIAEIKKASPSKGVIRDDFNPENIAQIYEENGATCLSVLTDEPYFQGADAYLQQVRIASRLPILRKDFIVDEYQIYESRVLGADCILLIVAALNDDELRHFYHVAEELGMDILVEVHDAAEMARAADITPMMVGVNNRNLKTLEVDVNISVDLAQKAPPFSYRISESGIDSHETVLALKQHGYQGFLVGESLMRQDDIGLATRTLLGKDA